MAEHDEALEEYRREMLEKARDVEVTTKGILAFEEGMVRVLLRSSGGTQELKVNELELQALYEAAGRHLTKKILERSPQLAELKAAIAAAESKVEDVAKDAPFMDVIDALQDEATAWREYAAGLERVLVENRDAAEAARIAGVVDDVLKQGRNNTRAHGEAIGDALRACGIGVRYMLVGPVELWDVAHQLEKRGYGFETPAYTVPVSRMALRSVIKALEAHGEHEQAEKIREALNAPARETDSILEFGWAGDEHAQTFYATQEEAEEFMGSPKRFARTKAGAWKAVE